MNARTKTYRSLWTAVAFALLLLAPAAPSHAAGGGLGSLLAWLRLWIGPSATTAHADQGPIIDPNGQPTTMAQTDQGPIIDPFGNPKSTAQGGSGPTIDPNGNPKSTAQGDSGPTIDPDGRPR